MRYISVFLGFFWGVYAMPAQPTGFSDGKSISELRAAIAAPVLPFFEWSKGAVMLAQAPQISATPLQSSVFLPRWTAEELPFFCKIEHKWGRKSRVPLKFRLGSVEYVDQLEGKGF